MTTDQPRSFIETARRAQIIDCAIETIAEMGYAQASLAQIAKRAGISTGVISYHFAGKDDLIGEIVRHIFEVGDAIIRPKVIQQTTARGRLSAFIAANVAFAIAHPASVAAMVEINLFARANRAQAPFDPAVTRERYGALTRILAWGQTTGEFRAFAVPIMADVILEAIDLRARRTAEPGEDFAAELVTLFDLATRAEALKPQIGPQL